CPRRLKSSGLTMKVPLSPPGLMKNADGVSFDIDIVMQLDYDLHIVIHSSIRRFLYVVLMQCGIRGQLLLLPPLPFADGRAHALMTAIRVALSLLSSECGSEVPRRVRSTVSLLFWGVCLAAAYACASNLFLAPSRATARAASLRGSAVVGNPAVGALP
ncbi:hypothetical protein FOZ63_020120, partial [Perkinsus olseni]